MLKRVISIVVMIAAMLGCVSINIFGEEKDRDNKTNIAFEVSYYTRVSCADEGYDEIENHFVTPYVMKITSVEQLKQYWNGESLLAPEVPSKYDDLFFESNFLYAVNWMVIDAPQHEISSVYYDGEKVNIMWTGKREDILGPEEFVNCLAIVECENTYREKAFQLKTEFEISYSEGTYYDDEYFDIKDHFTTPYAVKIASAEQLARCVNTSEEAIADYTEEFFENNCLFVVGWKEPGTKITHEIQTYCVNDFKLIWTETEQRELDGANSGNVLAFIECPNKYTELNWEIRKGNEDNHSGVGKVDFVDSYYTGICRGNGYDDIKNHFITPYITKITSAEQLKEAWSSDYSEVPEKYNDGFFGDKFLIAVNWNEYTDCSDPVKLGQPNHIISSVYEKNGKLNLVWLSTKKEEYDKTAYQSYIVLIECSNNYRDMDYRFIAREEQAIEFSFGEVSCSSGDIIDVPLIISHNPGIMGIQALITFDKDLLTPVSLTTAGEWKDNDKFMTDNMSNWRDGENPAAPNYISMSSVAKKTVSGDGEIFVLRFKVNENAPNTAAVLTINSSYFRDSQYNEMDNVLAYNGSVNISGSSEKIEYPYTINTITITNENGGVYKSAPTDSGFIVDVDITKNEERDSKDYFIVAVYSKDGSLLSLNYMKANISTNESFSCGVYIPRINGEIGEIKAFVWSSISDMMPLAESVSLK